MMDGMQAILMTEGTPMTINNIVIVCKALCLT